MRVPDHLRGALAVVVALIVSVLAAGPAEPAPIAAPTGRHFVETRGLWVQFENRGAETGWYGGEILELIGQPAVREEVVLQLRHMRAMGVNELVFELRTSDGPWPVNGAFPACERATTLGPLWPRPTQPQLAGLQTLFDLAHAHGMRVALMLNSTHMDGQPPNGNAEWLAAVLRAIKDKPAFDYAAFGGDRRHVDARPPFDGLPDSCGGESEAPLWLGPDSVEARYVQWAIGYALSLGLPAEKVSAEAIVGDYRHEARQGAGPAAQDRHLWPPLEVLRTVFDRLGIPEARRTYALSYYPHPKCAFVESFVPCTEVGQEAWSTETLRLSKERVGSARLTLAEFGTGSSVRSHAQTVESLGRLMRDLGLEGGVYWQWVNPSNQPQYTSPGTDLKRRGTEFVFNPQQRELADLYGFHLTAVPNGSFEDGMRAWKAVGTGTVASVAVESAVAPWRGASAVRLAPRQQLVARSVPIRVSPRTTYTTTANVRVERRGVGEAFVAIRYLTCKKAPSRVRAPASFAIRTASSGFETFPLTYATPRDACFVQIDIGARGRVTVDVDDVR